MEALRRFVPGVMLPALLAALPAQRQDAASMLALAGDLRIPVHTAAADLGHDYGIWAAGNGYKASFHDGMTFVPRLGADYPHNQPLSWRTTMVRRGGADLLAPGERPRHSSADYRYEYRFAAFTEAYDVFTGGLEQTFVFEELPGSGDLVITGAVDSMLRADRTPPAHQELLFRDADGRPIVRYGKAWAFDAAGAMVELATAHENGAITLRVPHDWLAQATLPVVVDPFVSFPVTISAALHAEPWDNIDIGRDDDAAQANVMVAWQLNYSAVDTGVIARLTDDDFTDRGSVFADLTTSWSADSPRCAYVGGADRWALVFRRHFVNSSGRSLLRCHVHASGDTTPSTSVIGLTPTSGNDWRPDVGGVEGVAAGSTALVVFQREHNAGAFADTWSSDVFGCLIDLASPNGSFGAAFPIETSGFVDSERPSVNQVAEGGAAWSWVCTMQTFSNLQLNGAWDAIGRRIASDGTVSTGRWKSALGVGTQYHQLQPVVEGNDGRYAALFATADTSIAPGKIPDTRGDTIVIERFDWPHGAAAPAVSLPPIELESATALLYESASLAFDTNDDSHFAALWTELIGQSTLRYGIAGYSGELTEGPGTVLPTNTLSGACTFDNDTSTFPIVLARVTNAGAAGTVPTISGRTLGYFPPGPTALVGPACHSAILRWLGNQQIGSETERLTSFGAPAGTGHFVLVSLARTNQPVFDPAVVSGCRLLVSNGPGFLGTLDFQVGSSPSWSFALPPWLPPTTLYFQDWVFDGSQFAATRRLEVPVIR